MTAPSSPAILSSHRTHLWALADPLRFDHFSWREEGAGALLLLGMHLSDPRPWSCARNPVVFEEAPGMIDLASKRILGKRFRMSSARPEADAQALRTADAHEDESAAMKRIDTIALINHTVRSTGFDPTSAAPQFPALEKEPGKLLPRPLVAAARITCERGELRIHSRNFTEISQGLHAEVVLLSLLSEELSTKDLGAIESFEFETTLKPCKMCAAFLHSVRSHTRVFTVRYEEEDPGPLAADTLLDRYGYH